MHEHVKVIT